MSDVPRTRNGQSGAGGRTVAAQRALVAACSPWRRAGSPRGQLAWTLGMTVDPSLAARALAEGDSPLTARETEVLSAARDHDTISELAQRLHLSPGTVRNHISAAIQKLGARTRVEAARIAERKGWV